MIKIIRLVFVGFAIVVYANTGLAQWQWKNVDSVFGPLPSSMHVFRTNDRLDDKPSIAYYVSVPLLDKEIVFNTQVGYGKRFTPTQYYKKEQTPLLVVNSSFFSYSNNLNLNIVIRQGKLVSYNIASVKQKGRDSLLNYYPTRGAIGIDRKRRADVAWIFTDSIRKKSYAFEDGPVIAKGQALIPTIHDLHNNEWKRWKMQTAVGGGPVLIHESKIRITNEEEMLFSKGEKDKHPRTAMGYTADGRLIILAIQGRFPMIAEGATLQQEAKILLDLGCIEALNLDGGGSSCLLVNGKETIKPSDKEGERPVPSVFLIERVK